MAVPVVGTPQVETRQRRSWTAGEDSSLFHEVRRLGIYDGLSSDWNAVAARFPRRTNKDCRKRWLKISKLVNKGLWSEEEDDRLLQAIELHGQKWTEVARIVQTRHADQCAKRWRSVLCQSGESTTAWTDAEDKSLLQAVDLYGHKWKLITEQYFPGRSAAIVRSRHMILIDSSTRINEEGSNHASPPIERPLMELDSFGMDDDFSSFDLDSMTDLAPNDMNFEAHDMRFDALDPNLMIQYNNELQENNDILHSVSTEACTLPSPSPSSESTNSTPNNRLTLDRRRKDSAPTVLTLADVQPNTLSEVLNILIRDRVKVSVAING